MNTDRQRRMLMVIDPQIDFIDGTLPVPGAAEAMTALARYVAETDGRYVCKVVTGDWHPYRHCSFSDCGGQWPRHCVADTVGAAIFPALVEPLNTTAGPLAVLHKGMDAGREEYSIFRNAEAESAIRSLVDRHGVTAIDICGIAGDVCVLATLTDGRRIFGDGMFNVLEPFSPSLDGGEALKNAINFRS